MTMMTAIQNNRQIVCAKLFFERAFLAVSFAMVLAASPVYSQTVNDSDAPLPPPQHSTLPTRILAPKSAQVVSPTKNPQLAHLDCKGGPCEDQRPQVTVNVPAPLTPPWAIHDRISWLAGMILGVSGIVLALSTLRKIGNQARLVEGLCSAAVDQAKIAMLNTESRTASERPWLVMTIEPNPDVPNGFKVMATNRGHTPAEIVSMSEEVRFAVDESRLPAMPEYRNDKVDGGRLPSILFAGETASIKRFCRDDLKGLCESKERLERVEAWEDKVFIYGKVTYTDLIAGAEKRTYKTSYCCWYIHGLQKSDLVMAGPREYHQHQ